jgi:type III secretory pathway component EscU
MLKEYMKAYIVYLIFLIGMYLGSSFGYMSFNPHDWDGVIRGFIGFLMALGLIFATIAPIVFDYAEKNL